MIMSKNKGLKRTPTLIHAKSIKMTTLKVKLIKPKKRRKKGDPLTMGQLLKKADALFSISIRKRDRHCLHPIGCESTNIQCSHYIGRAHKITRFDPDNCIALCYFHHFRSKDLGFEYQKQYKAEHGYDGQYTIFMKKLLGEERWDALDQKRSSLFQPTRPYLENLIKELSI